MLHSTLVLETSLNEQRTCPRPPACCCHAAPQARSSVASDRDKSPPVSTLALPPCGRAEVSLPIPARDRIDEDSTI